MILFDPKRTVQFTVDVTNAHDKESPMYIAQLPITGKVISLHYHLNPS